MWCPLRSKYPNCTACEEKGFMDMYKTKYMYDYFRLSIFFRELKRKSKDESRGARI